MVVKPSGRISSPLNPLLENAHFPILFIPLCKVKPFNPGHTLNRFSGISVIDWGNVMLPVSDVIPANALLPKLFILSGKCNSPYISLHSINASSPMYSSLDGKSNLHVNLQPLKAPASIVVKDSGKESIPERRGHSQKANCPILVTPSGIIRDPDKCEHRSKALSPIDAMLSGRVKCMRDSLFLRAPGGI